MLTRLCPALLVGALCWLSASSALAAEDPGLQATALRYYTMQHDVSKDVALRHLELQDDVMPSMGKVEELLGGRYGGAWFDPDDDGRLKVAVVDTESAISQAALDEVRGVLRTERVLTDIDFVSVEVSYEDLVAASHSIVKDLGTDAGNIAVGVDVKANAVRITSSVSESSENRVERLEQARATADVPVQEKAIDSEFRPVPNCASGAPFCDRPLRGGIEMSTGGRGCTAGFNVTSRSDGKRYLMTAGHCVTNSSWSTKTNLYGQWLEIGPEHNMQFWYSGKDAGIIRDKVPSYWQQSPFPTSTIWIDDIPGTHQQNNNYYIGQEANAIVNTVVCITGGGGYGEYPYDSERRMFWHGTPYQSYTWCGGVDMASDTVSYNNNAPAETVYNLVRTNICTWPGMSGGPVFKWNIAYGIWSGDNCTGGYQQGWFYPSILAENALNVDIVH